MQCPVCDEGLVMTELEGSTILTCMGCHGAWFTRKELVEYLIRATSARLFSHSGTACPHRALCPDPAKGID